MNRMLNTLEAAGVLVQRRGRVTVRNTDFDPESISLEREERRHVYERSRLDMMRGYAELRECRRRYILNYFGEDPEWDRCDWCDVDVVRDASSSNASVEEAPGPFAVNDSVTHVSLGRGLVQRVAPDAVTVLFEQAGYKTLGLDIVLEQHLLTKVQ
jgi:ATP-dependent DNA helicase RecQ